MARENSNFTVVGGCYDGIRLPLKEDCFGRDYRDLEHFLRVLQPLRGLGHSVDRTLHEESLLWVLIELASDKALERGNRLLELHILSFDACELLSDRERLRHETLDATRTTDDELVLLRQFVHAENRDDVLE